jgi:hypothetical protein
MGFCGFFVPRGEKMRIFCAESRFTRKNGANLLDKHCSFIYNGIRTPPFVRKNEKGTDYEI